MKLMKDLMVESYSGDYNDITEVIVDYLKDSGAKIAIQHIGKSKGNVIAVFGNPDVLINCHMDTVVPSEEWTYEPCSLTEKDGKLQGS